jgi:hypothetical protein
MQHNLATVRAEQHSVQNVEALGQKSSARVALDSSVGIFRVGQEIKNILCGWW